MPENIEETPLFTENFEFEEFILVDETEEQKLKKEAEEKAKLEKEEADKQLLETNTTTNTDSNTQESNDTSDNSSSSLSIIVTALGEEFGIELNQEELNKAENKYQYLRDQIQKKKQEEFKSTLTDEEKEVFESIKSGVPLKEYANTVINKNTYAALKEEDIKENKSLQEVLIKNRYITQGFSEQKANKMIADLKAISEERVIEEALESRVVMVEKEKEHEKQLKEKTKAEKETQEKERLASLEKVKSFVLAKKETIPGLELTESFKEDVYKSMTTAIAKDDKGNLLNEVQLKRSKDPIEFEYRMALFTKLGFFDEKPDFSKILKVAEQKTTKSLEKLLKEGIDFMPNGKSKPKDKDENDFGLDVFN